jgi:NAD(P)-dependent dehydrogenase (short-subunit alcohol dehydrogenase family)
MGELDGSRALITGGSTGLGLATARAFLREGARVAFTGRDEEIGRAAEVDLSGGGEATFLRADAVDIEQIDASVREAVSRLGGLDILVNNAGIGVIAPTLQTTIAEFDAVMAVNVRGYFRYGQACMPHLARGRGCMIHVGSDAGILGEVEIGVYSISKAAVHMMSNMFAIEGGRLGVRSNVVAPGDTEPGMRHMTRPGAPDRGEDDPASWPLPPIGRLGRATDVAEAAVYLASERASFANGIVLTLDGGMRAGYNTGTFRPMEPG